MNEKALQAFDQKEIRILIVDDNSPFVLPLLRSFSGLRNIRLDVLLIFEGKPNHFRYSRFLGSFETVDMLTDENVEPVIRAVAERKKSDLLIPTREWLSMLFYRHRSELEKVLRLHPLPKDSVLEITGNKWKLNKWLREHAFPYTRTAEIEKGWDGDYPVLLKPVFGIGGKGIKTIQKPNELGQLVQGLEAAEGDYFLQEVVAGHDIDISFFAVDGKIIYHTIQRGLISGNMVYSKGIEFVKNRDLLELAEGIVASLNYTGIAHLDFRYSSEKDSYFLVDFNARYWSSVQGSRAMGINFPLLVASWALSGKVKNTGYRTGHYYFTSTALSTLVKNLYSRKKYPVKLKDTQLIYIFTDPLPELMFLLRKIMRIN